MKKITLFLTLAFVSILIVSCSRISNEDRVKQLVEAEIKSYLLKPDSYKFVSMQIDSLYNDDFHRSPEFISIYIELCDLYRDYKIQKSSIESAERQMSLSSPSYGFWSEYSKQQYNQSKKDKELAQRKAEDKKAAILNLLRKYKDNLSVALTKPHELREWIVTFNYTAENAYGNAVPGSNYYYINTDFTHIEKKFTDDELRFLDKDMFEDMCYEFEDEINAMKAEE